MLTQPEQTDQQRDPNLDILTTYINGKMKIVSTYIDGKMKRYNLLFSVITRAGKWCDYEAAA